MPARVARISPAVPPAATSGALACQQRVGWQPSRFLADRGEAERAIGALCHELLSIAEVSAHLHLPLGVVASWSVTWPTSTWSWSTGRPRLAPVPTWPCWNGCWTGCAPSDEDFGLPSRQG
jgi:hypothetical protein